MAKTTMQFEAGDRVTWASQASGGWTEKTGEVVKVVPPKAYSEVGRIAEELGARSAFGGGMPRDHESYVVKVQPGKTGNAKPVLYWPVVSKLRPARKEPARAGSYATK